MWSPGWHICSYGFSYNLCVKTPKSVTLAQTFFFESYLNIHLLTLYLHFVLQNPQIQHICNCSHLSLRHPLPSIFGPPVSGTTQWPTWESCGHSFTPPNSLFLDEVNHQVALMLNACPSVEASMFFPLDCLLTLIQL